MIAFLSGRERDLTFTRFTCLLTLIRRFNAMVDSVSHQMHHRVRQGFDQILIQVRILTEHLQVDLFFKTSRQIANNARESTEYLFHRLHPGLHDRILQIRCHHIQIGNGIGDLFIAQLGLERGETVSDQHQLTNHVHDIVQTRSIDTHRGFATGSRRLLFDITRGFIRFGSWSRSGC